MVFGKHFVMVLIADDDHGVRRNSLQRFGHPVHGALHSGEPFLTFFSSYL